MMTLPSDWIKRNYLGAKSDLNIIDCGNTLLIESSACCNITIKEMSLKNLTKEEVKLKIHRAYRLGCHEIRIDISGIENPLVEYVEEIVSKLKGINSIRKENMILMYDASDREKIDAILKNTFSEIVVLTNHLLMFNKCKEWLETLSLKNCKIQYRLELIHRLITMSSFCNINDLLMHHALVLSLQCLARTIKNIGNKIYNQNIIVNLKYIPAIVKHAYDICIHKKCPKEYFRLTNRVKELYAQGKLVLEESCLVKQICNRLVERRIPT